MNVDDKARALAFRLRLMVLQQDAPFMSAVSVCSETCRIEDKFDIALRHALCEHGDDVVALWGGGTVKI